MTLLTTNDVPCVWLDLSELQLFMHIATTLSVLPTLSVPSCSDKGTFIFKVLAQDININYGWKFYMAHEIKSSGEAVILSPN